MPTIGQAKATLVDKIDSLTAAATAKDTIYLAKALKENTSHHSFTFQGAWAATTAYALDDVVTNGGNTYICIAAHTSGASFSVGSNWTMMASAGTDGSTVGTGTAGQVLKTNAAGTGIEWGEGEQTGTSITQFVHTSTFSPPNSVWHDLTAWVRQAGSGHFLANGNLVSEAGGVFSFSETGTYLIYGSVASYGGNSLRRIIVNGLSSKDGGSDWTEIGRAIISRYDTGGTVYTSPTWIGTMNVDNTTNSKFKVRIYVERATGSDTIASWDDHLPWTFIKLSEAY